MPSSPDLAAPSAPVPSGVIALRVEDFVPWVVATALVGTWSLVVLALNVLGVVCPRKPWMYVVGFVLLGFTVACGGCWVAAVVGLIFWARADTRQWLQGAQDGSVA